jgi:hypothetical protein
MADDHTEAAKKVLAEDKERREKAKEKMKGKPTPTQEENDLAMLGQPVHEKQDDGSGPDPYATRALEADKASGYATRASAPAHSSRHARASE